MTCRCHCYNRPDLGGDVPEVIIVPPWSDDTVCLDACIALTIQHLWARGFVTVNSCCGHNGVLGLPSVVVSSDQDPRAVARAIQEIDPGRSWEVLQWNLCTYPAPALK